MAIEKMHSFLVNPGKHAEEQPDISGTEIPKTGPLQKMLTAVFDRSPEECDIEIQFQPNEDGEQENDCRDAIVEYMKHPTIPSGRALAVRLQEVSTRKSGLGLMFLIRGRVGHSQRLVISRFPADQGVIAHEDQNELTIEFIERVFMKNAKAYKSAYYASDSLSKGFWDGRAIDRQISGHRELSDYWIRDFLKSELRTTGAAGTKRLALAIKHAIRTTTELGARQELIAAATLLRGQHGKSRSARKFLQRLNLSGTATNAIEKAFPRDDLMDEVFQFDREEFHKHAPYRAVELDNGGLLVADDAEFTEVFHQEVLVDSDGRVKFSTIGRVVNESLRKTK